MEQRQSKIYLLTTLFQTKTLERAAEFKKSILTNAAHEHIERIIIFFEGQQHIPNFYDEYTYLKHKKIIVLPIDTRPTYKLFFDYANEQLTNHYIVIANTDIYFDRDSGIKNVRKVKQNHLWTVTRYNYHPTQHIWALQGDGLYGSHDAWIFRSPIKDFSNEIVMGIVGCDSYLSQKAVEASIAVCNPAYSIKIKHEHHSRERNDGYGSSNNYWDKPDYMPLDCRLWLAPPSSLETPKIVNRGVLHRLIDFYRVFVHAEK